MNILDISIIIFILMELSNVFILYFAQDFKYGNGVSVFNDWHKSKNDDDMHLFAKYMTFWVAGTKLIFIVLLLVILFVGNETTKVWGVIVMILSIATYFWKLHPIMKKLDEKNRITPKGYSKSLFLMICGFILMFSIALILHLFL